MDRFGEHYAKEGQTSGFKCGIFFGLLVSLAKNYFTSPNIIAHFFEQYGNWIFTLTLLAMLLHAYFLLLNMDAQNYLSITFALGVLFGMGTMIGMLCQRDAVDMLILVYATMGTMLLPCVGLIINVIVIALCLFASIW